VGSPRPLRPLTTEQGSSPPEDRAARPPEDGPAGPPEHRAARPRYKGEPLDAARGPGLGCFWLQVAVLAVFVVITPIAALNGWPIEITVALLIATLVLTFFAGQTVIFLLRLVAADRRSRRRPMSSATRTVGELEDEGSEPRPDT
jgi:hypothetical protein